MHVWGDVHGSIPHRTLTTSTHTNTSGATLDFDLLGSPLREHAHLPSTVRPRLDEAFAAAEQEEGDPALRARLAAIPAQPLSPEAHGHRIDHGDELPH